MEVLLAYTKRRSVGEAGTASTKCILYTVIECDCSPGCAGYDVVLLRKALHPHVHRLDQGVKWVSDRTGNAYACDQSARQSFWLPGCMLSGELRRLTNEQGPLTKG